MLQATEYHLGQLKAKLAKLRTELQAPAAVSVHRLAIHVLQKISLHPVLPEPSSALSAHSTVCAYIQQKLVLSCC